MNKFAELISKSMPSDCHLNSDGNWNGINKKHVCGHVIPLFADKREDNLFVEAFPKLQAILETNGLDFNFKKPICMPCRMGHGAKPLLLQLSYRHIREQGCGN